MVKGFFATQFANKYYKQFTKPLNGIIA
jgi:hypothetical protein